MIGGEGRAQRAAGIAGGGLDPDVVEAPVAQDLAVGDAVQRDAAGQAQVRHPGLRCARARGQAQHDLLGHGLDGGGEIHLALR